MVLAIAAAIAMWRPAPAPSAPTAFVPVPLTSLAGSENHPSFSPDGSQVAFTWTREGDTNADLHVQLLGSTSTPLRLTEDDSTHGNAAWSPDGKSIALWHGPRGWSPNVATNIRLVLVAPLGGAERQVLEWNGPPRRIAWSPDGQWIAVSPVAIRDLRDKGVTLIAPSTGERVEWAAIDKSFAGSTDPVFSADGRRIAYIVQRDDFSADVFVAPVGAGGRPDGPPVHVSNAGQSARLPVWTADGEHLLLVNGFQSSSGSVVRVRVGSTEPFEAIPGLERSHMAHDRARWQAAGDRTGEPRRRSLAGGPRKSGRQRSDRAVYAARRGRRLLSGRQTHRVFVQPLGLARDLGRRHHRRKCARADSVRRSHPRISEMVSGRPRGSVRRQTAGNSEIFAVSASGGAVRQLTNDPGEDARPVWSHDGRWIYFASTRSGRSEMWRMSASGADPVQVTKTGAVWLAASVDGQWLHYVDIGIVFHPSHPAGRHRRQRGRAETSRSPSTRPKSGLWFFGPRKPGQRGPTLRTLRFADNTIRDVAQLEFAPTNVGLSVSPDERSVLVTRPDTNGLDLLLVNDFR